MSTAHLVGEGVIHFKPHPHPGQDQSAAAVLELSVLSDWQLGGVAWRQAVAKVGRAVTLLHLRQRRHQPWVRRIQGPDPFLLIG